MLEILRLIRIRTLVYAVFTMCTMRYCIILPLLATWGFASPVTNGQFLLLAIAICCLVSGAYIINDYFDVKPDRVSGVRTVVVGKTVSRRAAITLHTVLNVVAVAIAFYLSYMAKAWWVALLFLLVSGLLWGYSSIFKKHFMTSYVLVAFLAALIPLSSVVYEIPFLERAYASQTDEIELLLKDLFCDLLIFSWIVFLNTLIYEMNKDIYTMEGDRENGIKTFPVRHGVKGTRRVLAFLSVIALLSVVFLFWANFGFYWQLVLYLIVAVLLPYVIYIWAICCKENRSLQLNLLRGLMVTSIGIGIFLMPLFKELYMF